MASVWLCGRGQTQRLLVQLGNVAGFLGTLPVGSQGLEPG